MTMMEHFITLHSLYRNANQPPPPQDIQGIYKMVQGLHCRSEIIGSWVYCYAPPEYGLRLKYAGFWFSFKHGAFVYSGYPKGGPAGDESLNEIRKRLGSRNIPQEAKAA